MSVDWRCKVYVYIIMANGPGIYGYSDYSNAMIRQVAQPPLATLMLTLIREVNATTITM